MHSVLLADDEQIIRNGIRDGIEWERLGFELAAVASDGQEALDYFQHLQPAIVIADIRMPEMDGLELLRAIHEIHPETVCIILSAYGEFEYARKAMQYGVRHFLLKPLDEREIIRALQDARSEFDARTQQVHPPTDRSGEVDAETSRTIPQEEERRARSNDALRRAVAYLWGRYSDPHLSLEVVAAESAHVHPDYLSRLFRQWMGTTFSRYLAELRVRQARAIVSEEPGIRVYELADRVGYRNKPQYFSSVFRRITGEAPGEYARRIRSADRDTDHNS